MIFPSTKQPGDEQVFTQVFPVQTNPVTTDSPVRSLLGSGVK